MIIHLVDLTKSKRWLPTFGPSQSAWVTDLPKLTATVLHSPLPFITTQSESWYSFYHPTEGRRLSRPSCLVSYRAGFPVYRQSPIQALTRPSVEQPKSTALSRRCTHAKQRCGQTRLGDAWNDSVLEWWILYKSRECRYYPQTQLLPTQNTTDIFASIGGIYSFCSLTTRWIWVHFEVKSEGKKVKGRQFV